MENRKKTSVLNVLEAKNKKKLSMITCYDAAFARLIDKTDIDMVLVGDSVGNVCMGEDGTIPVTVDDMVHYSRCVSKGLTHPLLVTDLPFMSYKISREQALTTSSRIIQEGGANAVKMEGGVEIADYIKAIVDAGIPVMGHVGFTPQSINSLGGFKIQGKTQENIDRLKKDVIALQEAGVFSIVFELIPDKLASELTSMLDVPTIGIGAGPHCDGQVLVLHDLLGFSDEFNPKFLKKYANLSSIIVDAVSTYSKEVKEGVFPDMDHSY